MRNRAKSKAQAKAEALKALTEGRKWLHEHEAAGYLGLAPFTLQKWRIQGATGKGETPPKCYKRGTQTFYKLSELDEWIEQGLVVGGDDSDREV